MLAVRCSVKAFAVIVLEGQPLAAQPKRYPVEVILPAPQRNLPGCEAWVTIGRNSHPLLSGN